MFEVYFYDGKDTKVIASFETEKEAWNFLDLEVQKVQGELSVIREGEVIDQPLIKDEREGDKLIGYRFEDYDDYVWTIKYKENKNV